MTKLLTYPFDWRTTTVDLRLRSFTVEFRRRELSIAIRHNAGLRVWWRWIKTTWLRI